MPSRPSPTPAAQAYVPEHLPDYFCSFSDSEAFVDSDLMYYMNPGEASIICYPLHADSSVPGFEDHVSSLVKKIKPSGLRTISPVNMNIPEYKCKYLERDYYSCLELDKVLKNAKLRNMLKRAAKDVHVDRAGAFTREHLDLLSEFIRRKGFDRDKAAFYHRLPDYLSGCPRGFIFEARRVRDRSLAGFTVFDMGPGDYCFYLFNMAKEESRGIPGLNDLLLDRALDAALSSGKKFANMGLGVSSGIERFKAKWGACRFLPYHYQYFEPAFSWKNFFSRG